MEERERRGGLPMVRSETTWDDRNWTIAIARARDRYLQKMERERERRERETVCV